MARNQTTRSDTSPGRPDARPVAPPPEAADRVDGPGQAGARATDDDRRQVRYEGAGIAAGFVALLLVAALVLIIVGQNIDDVPFEFLWWEAQVSLAVLLLATAFVAVLASEAVGLVWRRRRRRVRELTARGETRR
jgi:uncharacterized integral membrane protein